MEESFGDDLKRLYLDSKGKAEQDAGLIANAPTDLSTLLAIVEIQAKALEEGSEYSRCDDINGNAGEICKDAISAIQTLLSEVRG